jgi:non-ribosomal peptide synthetase component F
MGTGAAHAAGELPRLAAASTVATLFEGQARLFPDRIAVVDGARELSYR